MPELAHRVVAGEAVGSEACDVVLARGAGGFWVAGEDWVEGDGDGSGVLGVGVGPFGCVGVEVDWVDVVAEFVDDGVPGFGDAAEAGEVV